MSKGGGGEKTEKPTAKKKAEGRKQGQIARTQDIGAWAGVLVAGMLLDLGLPAAARRIRTLLTATGVAMEEPGEAAIYEALTQGGKTIALVAGPFCAVLMVVSVGLTVAQGGPILATKNFKPQLKRLNPVAGFKRIAGPLAVWELVKSLVKSAVVTYVLWRTVQTVAPLLVEAGALSLSAALGIVTDAAVGLIRDAAMAGIVMGVLDYMVQYRKTAKEQKMSLQEVKDEHRQSEGDPAQKGHIRSRQMAMSRNRMMVAVKDADVVLVNPTHVAVALRYDPARGAPRVVAKGAGAIAARIRAEAETHRVPMVQDVPLARALHAACELGTEVPPELYGAVARVLAFVLSLKARGSAAGTHRVHDRVHAPARPRPRTAGT